METSGGITPKHPLQCLSFKKHLEMKDIGIVGYSFTGYVSAIFNKMAAMFVPFLNRILLTSIGYNLKTEIVLEIFWLNINISYNTSYLITFVLF